MKKRQTKLMENEMMTAYEMVQNKLEILPHQRNQMVSEGRMKKPEGVYTIGGTNMKCG